ncbi:MAG: PIN domain-containing protein [Gammaproteobacteria bacterium]|nr:PIN domain-containing protein [Gammaproteobacteria bacterium]
MPRCVVVSDSSVLIDLERGAFFAAAFALPLEFCVPDVLYRREIEPFGGDRLVDMGLRVLELDGAGVARAAQYRRAVPALSVADAFALALARSIGGALLTGDARLRRLAGDEKVTCHGVLWLLDRMLQERSATPRQLHDGLVKIRDHPRCRLPTAEVSRRLQVFERAGKTA